MNRFNNIAFEISNQCNYSAIHPLCPNDPNAEPIFLETQIIMDVMSAIGPDYQAQLYFSIYNEPLLDPRFFSLLDVSHIYLPKAYINLFTNGWNLNQWMLDELVKKRVKNFHVAAYSPKEFERLSKLEVSVENVNYNVVETNLDNRLEIYNRQEATAERISELNLGECVWAPTSYLFITHKGEVALCCMDGHYTTTFGDLHTEKIEDIFASDRVKEVCSNMKVGKRELPICRQCCGS